MKLEPFLLANSLRLVLAQRLMRRLCAHCSEQTPLPLKVVTEYKLTREQIDVAHHRVAKGCSRCMKTGYRGRVAVYVVWMYEAGIARALAGETTFDEVQRVLVREQ